MRFEILTALVKNPDRQKTSFTT